MKVTDESGRRELEGVMTMDVHTRRLRHFVVVAETLHFSKAADILYVSQQGLSRSIAELEREVGALLLKRTTRTVELTEAGQIFLEAARESLSILTAGAQAAHQAHTKTTNVLRVGLLAPSALELTSRIIATFRTRYPSVTVELKSYDLTDPSCGLQSGESDVAFLRLPVDINDLRTEVLFTEPRAVSMSPSHRLASSTSLRLSALEGEVITAPRTGDARWRAFWTLRDTGMPEHHLPRIGQANSSLDEELENVAAGLTIAISVPGMARFAHRPSIVYRPLEDVSGSQLAVGWCGHASSLVRAFLTVVTAVRHSEHDLIAQIESGTLGSSDVQSGKIEHA